MPLSPASCLAPYAVRHSGISYAPLSRGYVGSAMFPYGFPPQSQAITISMTHFVSRVKGKKARCRSRTGFGGSS